jgi:PIN domain nuclease of toxin-antitoxin system
VILIDTHILLWWQENDDSLRQEYRDILDQNNDEFIAISTATLMEIICLYDRGRIILPESVEQWLLKITSNKRLLVIPISSRIAVEAFRLPGDFHKDPADRIIVASARILNCSVMTQDNKILKYTHVKII